MRVLVTRPREQGERTAERLLALGHEPFCAPLLTIRPTLQPAPSGGFDALIVTSANAIATLISWRSEAAGARLLHIAGRDRKPEPLAALARAGFKIETWTAYEAVAAKRLPEELAAALSERRIDAPQHY